MKSTLPPIRLFRQVWVNIRKWNLWTSIKLKPRSFWHPCRWLLGNKWAPSATESHVEGKFLEDVENIGEHTIKSRQNDMKQTRSETKSEQKTTSEPLDEETAVGKTWRDKKWTTSGLLLFPRQVRVVVSIFQIPWAPYESLRESQGGKQCIFDTKRQNRDVGSGKSLQINNSS